MRLFCCLLTLLAVSALHAEGNLLRNGDFQDDWLTLLPELKNHHWNYTTEVFNRRDYNPDGWRLSGKWQWLDADKPRGQRRLMLSSPAQVVQSVNWLTINNPRKLEGWPDAGGFPAAEAVRSKNPLALVRDLTCRVRLSATNLPKGAASLTIAWSNASPVDDPAGSKRTASASVPVPEGTYRERTVEVKLPAATWLEAARKDPQFAAQGALIPMAATCEIAIADKQAGSLELHEASLEEAGTSSPNLLPNGGFEATVDDRIVGWSRPQKYRYFPPGIYYIFNTWHNSNSPLSSPDTLAVATSLVRRTGRNSLAMRVPPGDEYCLVSNPVQIEQREARLIEVRAWIKTEQAAMIQIDAEDEKGQRLDCFNFIHKNPLSIGSNDWRQIRQVFRPAAPLKSIRLKLCVRGMNGYTLDDTGDQPQQNASGLLWWDDVHLVEPESTLQELAARKLTPVGNEGGPPAPHLEKLSLGEQLHGTSTLTAELVNPGADGTFVVGLEVEEGQTVTSRTSKIQLKRGRRGRVELAYQLRKPGVAYRPVPGLLYILDHEGRALSAQRLDLSTWTVPIDLELGALYLRPTQKLFVRANLGLAHAEMAKLKEVRLDVVRRGTGQVLKSFSVPASPDAIQKQRAKLPDGLREDLRNLVLTDLDVSFLPVQPFTDPQRNWIIRAAALDNAGKEVTRVESHPFCRLAHDGPQPAISSVKINEQGDFLVNDKPWMPWGVTYGHNPVYDGPADPGKYHDLANLKPWGLYDRHGGNLVDRSLWDLNCLRHVEGPQVTRQHLEDMWKKGLYASTVFLPPLAPGKAWPADHLAYLKTAPMVAAVSRGPEEAFGLFSPMTDKQLADLRSEVDRLRQATGKPVMVGHGGYWTRLEFEKVPFFDIYDPETEPLYPAPLHTDMNPLVVGQRKAVWLRPQMYESVPYERWRYHVFVELMRGARGWQIAHGPGDASLMRGLHAELRHLQPFLYSREKTPAVRVEPGLEHLVRRLGNRAVIVAASTHGMSFGNWRWSEEKTDHGQARVTADPHIFRDESDGYHATGEPAAQALVPHGIQYLADARSWPAGSKLVTWVRLDPKAPPTSLVALVKADGRWIHAGSWGKFNAASLRADRARAFWFLRTFYRHARGFLGWGNDPLPHTLAYIPGQASDLGPLPKVGEWVKLEVPLEKLGATGKLLDGVGFLHEGGRVLWADTRLIGPDGKEQIAFGSHEDRPEPAKLEKVKIAVAGLRKGTKVKVLFEDREIVAEEGYFLDDFRGTDLYQRHGGERSGYGNAPVALHIYEVAAP